MVSDIPSLLEMSVRAKRKVSSEEVSAGAEGTGRRRSSRAWKPTRNILENLECRVEETEDGGSVQGRERSCSPEFGELVKLEVANVWGLAGLEDRGEEDYGFRGFPAGAAREPYVRLRKIHNLMAIEAEKGEAVSLHVSNLMCHCVLLCLFRSCGDYCSNCGGL